MAFLDSGFYPHPDLTRPENRILQSVDATGERAVEEASFLKAQVSSWHGMMTSCVAAGNGFMSDELYRGTVKVINPRIMNCFLPWRSDSLPMGIWLISCTAP